MATASWKSQHSAVIFSDTDQGHHNSPWLEVWIFPRTDGKWEAKAGCSERALCVTQTQREAVAIARVHAKKLGADLLIQEPDGKSYLEASFRASLTQATR